VTFVPFDRANQISDAFLELLKQRKISPPPQSGIEDEFLSVTSLLEIWREPEKAKKAAHENQVIRNAAGIHDFAAKLLSARELPEFISFDPHLKLIAKGKLRTTLSQITENNCTDDTARKLVELYVACLAVHCGKDLRLDHPEKSKGDNPDILLSYGQQQWAIAIKTISSRHGQTIFERIGEAAQQVERSNANKGLVLLNVRDIIDHDALWNASFRTVEEATEALRANIEKISNSAGENRNAADWKRVFDNCKAVLPVLFLGQSVMLLPTSASTRTPTPLKMIVACGFNETLDLGGTELASCLNHWMQCVLQGEPGPPPF
jgi:hypothetical protein